jgi:arginyl-tRNA synthetase
MSVSVTEQLSRWVEAALGAAGLEPPADLLWDVPREESHGDYASNVAMALASSARRRPRDLAELIAKHLPPLPAVDRVEVAGPGFLNVFLAPAWCREGLREVLGSGDSYGSSDRGRGAKIRIEFVSANPTGPLVIVSARAAAVGDSLARILRSQGHTVFTEYYVNDAGTQFQTLGRSLEVRVRQALGEDVALPEGAYPGDYLVDLAKEWLGLHGPSDVAAPDLSDRLGRFAVDRIVAGQRKVLSDYGVEFDRWVSESREVRRSKLPPVRANLVWSPDRRRRNHRSAHRRRASRGSRTPRRSRA